MSKNRESVSSPVQAPNDPLGQIRAKEEVDPIASIIAIMFHANPMSIISGELGGGILGGLPGRLERIDESSQFAHTQSTTGKTGDIQKAGYRVARVESPDQPLLSRINQELARS